MQLHIHLLNLGSSIIPNTNITHKVVLIKFHNLKHTRISDKCVFDLSNISDMRFLFDAYQYDPDEMQTKYPDQKN